jgi:zinc transporter 9
LSPFKGVIVPEGIETLVSAHPSENIPTSKIALSLIVGFTFMMVVEQLIAPHSHSHSSASGAHDISLRNVNGAPSTVEFDAEMGDENADAPTTGFMQVDAEDLRGSRERAYPLTFGLIMHGLN